MKALGLALLLISPFAFGQSAPSLDAEFDDIESEMESEMSDLQSEPAPLDPPAGTIPTSDAPIPTQAAPELPEDAETVALDLGPEEDAARRGLHRRPPGPVQGGIIKVPHPDAAKGLIRINKDGSYQYKTPLRPKSQAMSVRMGVLTPPSIEGPAGVTFKNMYGSNNLFALAVDYEWQPFQSFGAFGLQLGTGFSTATGTGTLAGGNPALESYNLFIVPMSAFLVYRFEYVRRQWVVPFVNGGGTFFGLAEKRDDDKPMQFAGAAAVGGGGGIHFSISRLDPEAAFTLDREYGVADLWFTLEARVMQGLDQEMDFSSQQVTGGVTVDF